MSIRLSENTVKILTNYSIINPNLRVSPGHFLRTMDVKKTIYSEAKVEEEFTTPFAIYDLKEFLSTLSLFETPELTFNAKVVTIVDQSDASLKTQYYSADLALIEETPHIDTTSRLVSIAKFQLSAQNLRRLQTASHTMKLNDLKFVAEKGVLNAEVYDRKGSNNNSFTVTLDTNWEGNDFEVHVAIAKLTIVPGTYLASVLTVPVKDDAPAKPVALDLTDTEQDLQYVISFDAD